MRSLVLFLVGLAVGAMCTLIAVNALDRGTSHHDAVMTLMGQQMKSIDQSIKASRCASTDLMPRLQTLLRLAFWAALIFAFVMGVVPMLLLLERKLLGGLCGWLRGWHRRVRRGSVRACGWRRRGHLGRYRAKILAHDQRVGAHALERGDA